MAGNTEQNPDSRIAELRAKIASLEDQWARALAEVEQVSRELEALESEPKRLSRKLRLTKNAPQKFDQMLEEAKERLTEERKRVVRERYQRLAEERADLQEEVEKTLGDIVVQLGKLVDLHYMQLALADEGGFAGPSMITPQDAVQRLLRRKLRYWL